MKERERKRIPRVVDFYWGESSARFPFFAAPLLLCRYVKVSKLFDDIQVKVVESRAGMLVVSSCRFLGFDFTETKIIDFHPVERE